MVAPSWCQPPTVSCAPPLHLHACGESASRTRARRKHDLSIDSSAKFGGARPLSADARSAVDSMRRRLRLARRCSPAPRVDGHARLRAPRPVRRPRPVPTREALVGPCAAARAPFAVDRVPWPAPRTGCAFPAPRLDGQTTGIRRWRAVWKAEGAPPRAAAETVEEHRAPWHVEHGQTGTRSRSTSPTTRRPN